MLKGTAREAAAEFLGTFILIAFGVGVVAQTVLSKEANGSFLGINIGWGLAVMLGIYVSAGVSGAHLNPAVTIALAVHRAFPWNKVVPYSIAQIAGAFVASAVVYATYREALFAFDGLSYDEIARRQGISKNTVGTRVLRARRRLRALFGGGGDE